MADSGFLTKEALALREQGIIDKSDANNPIYTIRYNGVDYKVSFVSVKAEHRDWMADNLSRMLKSIIGVAEESGRVKKLTEIKEVLNIR